MIRIAILDDSDKDRTFIDNIIINISNIRNPCRNSYVLKSRDLTYRTKGKGILRYFMLDIELPEQSGILVAKE